MVPKDAHEQTLHLAEEALAKAKPKVEIDFDAIKLPVNLSVAEVKKTITGMPLTKKFPKGQFAQTMMDAAFSLNCYWSTSGTDIDEKLIVVLDSALPYLPPNVETVKTTFVPFITVQGNLMSMYIKHPAAGRSPTEWFNSRIELINAANAKWYRMEAGQDRYHYSHGQGIQDVPQWPEGFDGKKHFQLAVEKYVVAEDGQTLRQLRGEE